MDAKPRRIPRGRFTGIILNEPERSHQTMSKTLSFDAPSKNKISGQASLGSPWPEIVTTRYSRLTPPASHRGGGFSVTSEPTRPHWPSHGVTGLSRLRPFTVLLHTRCTTVFIICLHALYFSSPNHALTRYQLTVSTVSRPSPNQSVFHVTRDSGMYTAVSNTSELDTPRIY